MVDRGQPLETEHIRRNNLDNHRDQASLTSLEVIGCEDRYYEEASGRDVVEMILLHLRVAGSLNCPDCR